MPSVSSLKRSLPYGNQGGKSQAGTEGQQGECLKEPDKKGHRATKGENAAGHGKYAVNR